MSLSTGQWFSPGTAVSSANKTDCHNITEILLKMVLNTTFKKYFIDIVAVSFMVKETWAGFELTTLVVTGTDCIGSYKSNYHTNTTTKAPKFYLKSIGKIKLNQTNVLLDAPNMLQWVHKNIIKDTFLTSKLTCTARFSYQRPCASFSGLWTPLCNNNNFCHHNPTVVIYKTQIKNQYDINQTSSNQMFMWDRIDDACST